MSTWHPTAIVVTFAIAVFATILALNFTAGEKEIKQHLEHHYGVADSQFLRSMGVLLGPALVDGNQVTTLLNGDQIFPSMLQAIRGAKSTVTFETYIYWSGSIGKEFADALSDRARNGVSVHVMLDWVGSQKMDEPALDQMREAGVEIEKYHPPRWYTLNRLNNRTHRKLLVVDGRIGFTGGVGIADNWTGHAQDAEHWRDTHYRIEGPAVAQMQAAFTDNWTKVTGKVLHTADYFPPLLPAGPQFAQIFQSSSEGGAESMHLMYLLSIAAAAKSIHLSMAYFVPDEVTRETLIGALDRGVKVQIILPGPIRDAKLVGEASRAGWGELLERGAEIYEYQPTMYHCKVLTVDGLWTSVGSTNFDSRSFRLNDEANLNVYDREFAQHQITNFEEDLKRSRRVTYDEWKARPWIEKLRQKALTMFNAQW
ncbi:MAG TPA: phospholipase D-like domain-containing protein [Burkholderiales bacterium]|nr:phospholipase D-like domain-containing protein [Burkholderiales bacterium]